MTPASGEVALFPLNTVLFPGGLLPLRVFEQRYLAMAKDCLRTGEPFGVCLIREGAEVGQAATPETVGCLARIVHWDMQQLGVLQITAQGEQRFRILRRRVRTDGLALAGIETLPEARDAALPGQYAACAAALRRLVEEHGERIFAAPHRFDSCAWVGERLAELLPLPLREKQELLELGDGAAQLQRVAGLMARLRPQAEDEG
jgi:Lon protease-like protein